MHSMTAYTSFSVEELKHSPLFWFALWHGLKRSRVILYPAAETFFFCILNDNQLTGFISVHGLKLFRLFTLALLMCSNSSCWKPSSLCGLSYSCSSFSLVRNFWLKIHPLAAEDKSSICELECQSRQVV